MNFAQYLPTSLQRLMPGETGGTPDQLPQDDTMMQLELKRKFALADALKNQEMPQGKMVSDHYVAPSWTQYLANALGKYSGMKGEEAAIKQYGDYQTAEKAKRSSALADLIKGMNPEAVTTTTQQPVTKPLEMGANVPTSPFGTTDQVAQTAPNFGGTAPQSYTGETTSMQPVSSTTMRPRTQQEQMANLLKYGTAIGDNKAGEDIVLGMVKQSFAPKEIEYIDLNNKLVPVDKLTKQPVPGLEPLEKGMTPGEESKAKWEQYKFYNPSATDLMQNKTTVRGQNITLRGQNLTDVRAKQQNDIAQGKTTFERTNTLRNDFTQLPEVKSWNVIQPLLVSARQAAKDTTGGSDLNLIYAMGKVMDPNSVVREGELQLAGNTGSFGDKLKGYYKSVAAGGNLDPAIKQDLLTQIESRAASQEKLYNNTKTKYGEIASQYGLNPNELFVEGITTPVAPPKVGAEAPPMLNGMINTSVLKNGTNYQGLGVWDAKTQMFH